VKLVLTPAQSRAVALGILLILIGLLYLAVGQPLLGRYRMYQEAIDGALDHLAHYRGMIAARPALEARLAQLRQKQGATPDYLHDATPALAAAELQEHVKRMIEEAGGKLVSTQSLPIQEEGRFLRITVKVQMSGDVDVARKVFYGLESGTPRLFLTELYMRGRARVRRVRGRDPVNEGELDVRFDLYGYIHRGDA